MITKTGNHNGRKLNIVAVSQRELEGSICPSGCAIISIVSPDSPEANITGSPVDVLRMSFYDLSEPLKNYEKVFEQEDAKRVRSFVEKHVDLVKAFVVQCEAGVSRSVGLAAALAKVLFGDDRVFFKEGIPNQRVYSKVMEEFKGNPARVKPVLEPGCKPGPFIGQCGPTPQRRTS